jgi:excisionase family DNA binding protein
MSKRAETEMETAVALEDCSDGLATVAEAGEFLSLSRAKIYALMNDGALPFCIIGGSRRIPRRALRTFAEGCLAKPGALARQRIPR